MILGIEKENIKYVLIICLVSFIMIFLYGKIDYESERFSDLSLHGYRAIAESSPKISTNIRQPYVYRILGPYLIGLLPIKDATGFYLFSIILSITLTIMYFNFLGYFGIKGPVAVITIILFIFNKYFWGFNVWDYFQINDVLSSIYLIILFWSLFEKKWHIFAFTMFLGALTRETFTIMIPVAFCYLVEKKEITSEWRKFILSIIPSIAFFISLRLFLPGSEGNNLLQAFLIHFKKLASVENWFNLLISPFIPLSFIPIIFFRQSLCFFQNKKYMIVFFIFVLISTSFGYDNQRLMSPAFLVFYLLIAKIIEEQIYPDRSIIAIMIFSAFVSSLHHVCSRYTLPSRNITILLSIGALMITSIALFTKSIQLRNTQ